MMHWFWRVAIAVGVGVVFGYIGVLLASNTGGQLPPIIGFLVNHLGERFTLVLTLVLSPIGAYLMLSLYLDRNSSGEPKRCRKCGYILRGITEPRCPECGEGI